jgi:(p)ppGpp synthase/HD superfamily hydrolase
MPSTRTTVAQASPASAREPDCLGMAEYDTGNGRLNPPTAGAKRWKPPPETRPRASRSNCGSRRAARARSAGPAERAARAALEVAEIVRTLDADDDVVIAAMLQPLLEAAKLWIGKPRKALRRRAGAAGARLESAGPVRLAARLDPERGLEPAQAEALRKMLLAVIGDVRLVVVRLAEAAAKNALRQVPRRRRSSASSRPRPARSTRRSPIAWACGR